MNGEQRSGATASLVSRFAAAGAWNTLFGYAAFAALVALFSPRVHYVWLGVAGNVLAITNAFVVHKLFVFKTKGNGVREYLRYYVVYGGTAVVGLALLAVFASGLGLNLYLAQAVALAVQAAISFVGHRRFSFGAGLPSRAAAPGRGQTAEVRDAVRPADMTAPPGGDPAPAAPRAESH
jgi:putative flippase GtrA